MEKIFNKRERRLIEDIESAEQCVSENCELEMDFWNDGWYVYEYNGDESKSMDDFSTEPLITEEEIQKENVDVYAVFDYCHIAYCG